MSLISLNIDISIITVNYKSWHHLENCLNSIQNINFKNLKVEVIVVDNCSNDGKLNDFRNTFPEFKFIENTGNNGFANGCNLGAKSALGNYLFFLNPDTIVTKDPIQKMFRFLELNADCGIVSCKQKNKKSYEKVYRFFPKFYALFGFLRALNNKKLIENIRKEENVIYPNWVSGAIVFISRVWFDKINGWNEDYWMYYEDTDLSKKVRDINGEVALLTNTQIAHNHGGASRLNLKTASITKTEVLISKHVYINNHFEGIYHFFLQFLTVLNTLISKLILGVLGVFFFFIPKLRLNVYLLINIIKYYTLAVINTTWLSEKSMNHTNKKA
jgi:GT2 family glycosyltransferase